MQVALRMRQGLLGTIVAASHQFRTEVARLGSRSDDFEVFGGDTGCAVTGVVVLGVEVFQVAAERGQHRQAERMNRPERDADHIRDRFQGPRKVLGRIERPPRPPAPLAAPSRSLS